MGGWWQWGRVGVGWVRVGDRRQGPFPNLSPSSTLTPTLLPTIPQITPPLTPNQSLFHPYLVPPLPLDYPYPLAPINVHSYHPQSTLYPKICTMPYPTDTSSSPTLPSPSTPTALCHPNLPIPTPMLCPAYANLLTFPPHPNPYIMNPQP